MIWIVQKKINGVWEYATTFPTREGAREAVRGAKHLFPGDVYRVRKPVAEAKPKVAERELKDLWGYLPIRFQEEVRDHDKGCATDCGVKWLREQLIQAGVDINR
jgi:hypothetical protein